MEIRPAQSEDFERIWPFFQRLLRARETFAQNPEMSFNDARWFWCESAQRCYVATRDDEVLGSYFIKPNGMGPSEHICNGAFIVAPEARRQGVGEALGRHALTQAQTLGYQAMQFNSVLSCNKGAVALWHKLGFEVVGVIPKGYRHRLLGLVDTLVMYRWLQSQTGGRGAAKLHNVSEALGINLWESG